ncbi:EAL domain-containing protein [Robertmurraya yapensis]|uniref:EAL domain-containing protein n=2 Tax=Bacillaceae TaxID=186817 RepID=A0A431WAJ9_9BACI|nr:EAL-associated domain-containing protein [Bacillus yapensis]RTR32369.1 EAL domain-containing protein [Bacillus yapensis]TKS96563.1 EAL domain-containing protein [Bacillus yapensis]
MDALDILTDLDNVVPFFQPIFSADEHRVVGYEVLGRYKKDDSYISLGPYFLDETIPEEYRLDLDNTVLKKALEQASSLDEDVMLFINRDADLLLYDDESLLEILLGYDKQGVSVDRIVIEISLNKSQEDIERLGHLITYYKTYGIKIAFDKLGDNSHQIDLIGLISPNILKVDLQALRSINLAPSFQDIIYSYSLLARKIGATLLFENIEMVYQLQYAWKNGGRYYQGYYLQKPDARFVDRNVLKEKLKKECQMFINSEKKKLEAQFEQTEGFQTKVTELLQKHRKIEKYEELLKVLAKEMEQFAFRMYICDEDGFQLSPNIFKDQSGWLIQEGYLHKNWSWRPYFLENILKMRKERKGILSDLYSDIETGESIRTFSYPLKDKQFLFIDISYDFISDHHELL